MIGLFMQAMDKGFKSSMTSVFLEREHGDCSFGFRSVESATLRQQIAGYDQAGVGSTVTIVEHCSLTPGTERAERVT